MDIVGKDIKRTLQIALISSMKIEVLLTLHYDT